MKIYVSDTHIASSSNAHVVDTQVALLVLADSVNTALNIAWIYNILINQFGKVSAIVTSFPWAHLRMKEIYLLSQEQTGVRSLLFRARGRFELTFVV